MKIIRESVPKLTRQEVLQLYREAIVAGVPLEDVQKRIGGLSDFLDQYQDQRKRTLLTIKKEKRKRKILPVVFITVGSMMMANALWPILSHGLFISPALEERTLVAPIPQSEILRSTSVAIDTSISTVNAVAHTSLPKPLVVKESLDYTNLANWFDEGMEISSEEDTGEEYVIDIPSLDIEKAVIKVGGTDLNSNLIQYPDTAEPGELGAPVIFGHSVLRQFYNPDINNPRRYKSIFSKIMTLKHGEEIFITYKGVKYSYRVITKTEVQPEDTYILEQYRDRRELKLVTCVPEGTYLRRGVVTAGLESVELVN